MREMLSLLAFEFREASDSCLGQFVIESLFLTALGVVSYRHVFSHLDEVGKI